MTERERFIKALKREPIVGHCPTFELVFFLTLESIDEIDYYIMISEKQNLSVRRKSHR